MCGFRLRPTEQATKEQEIYLTTTQRFFSSLVLVFMVTTAWAQNERSNSMLKEVSAGFSNEAPDVVTNEVSEASHHSMELTTVDSMITYKPAVLPLVLPEKPAPQPAHPRVVDKKFMFVMASLGGAEALRLATHKLVLDNEFAAGAPWVTSVPDNRKMVAEYGAIYLAELLVAYELKKPHSWLPGDRFIQKIWFAYPSAMTAIHIKNGIRSMRTTPPAGCPPELCQGGAYPTQ